MRNKKFNITGYHPYRSSQFREPSQQLLSVIKARQSPYKSAFFKREIISKSKQAEIEDILAKKQGVFSLEKLSFQKKKEEKQLQQSAKLPNFSIKRFFERSANKKCNQPLFDMSASYTPSSAKRQVTAQPALKRYWQRFLNEEITHADLTRELNKNIADSQRQRKNYSDYRNNETNRSTDQNKVEKSAFYINNFIKTTYRKRRFDQKMHAEEQIVMKQPQKMEQIVKENRKDDPINHKNWSMVPWQKENDNQQEELFSVL